HPPGQTWRRAESQGSPRSSAQEDVEVPHRRLDDLEAETDEQHGVGDDEDGERQLRRPREPRASPEQGERERAEDGRAAPGSPRAGCTRGAVSSSLVLMVAGWSPANIDRAVNVRWS